MSARVLRTPLLQAAWIDYDGDGDMDLFHNIDNAQDKLLVNDGSGIFTNVGERASASRPRLCDMRLTTSNRARVLAGGLDRRRQRRLESGFVRLGVGRLGQRRRLRALARARARALWNLLQGPHDPETSRSQRR